MIRITDLSRKGLIPFLVLAAVACEPEVDDCDSQLNVNPVGSYILCEGNYGGGNASLWQVSPDADQITPGIYQDLTCLNLGDTGQSLHIAGERLYVVVNGSSTLEVFDLSGSNLKFVRRIDLAGAGPRELAVSGVTGYLSCWNLAGILILDLESGTVRDTIPVAGLPEDLLITDGYLYVAVPWEVNNDPNSQVLKFEIPSGALVETYEVGLGPQQLLLDRDMLFVGRQWYDSTWVPQQGLARIDLTTGEVLSRDTGGGGGSADLFKVQGDYYLATAAGVAQFDSELVLQTVGLIGAGLSNIYSAGTDGTNILIGNADYSGPGQLYIFTPAGVQLAIYQTGVIPGAIVSYQR